MTIPEYVTNIISEIESHGHEAYIVGGCVRDLLMDKTPNDWDMTTSATPQEIMDIFQHLRTIPTGIAHGTVTIIADGEPIEITTYRIDGDYNDNRRPSTVTFSTKLSDDLMRRDFTINAMAYNPSSGLVDLYNGREDLSLKIIRTVGDPKTRFSEDALRIMRAIRFSATLNFEIHPDTEKAIFYCRDLLKNIASERIATELNKTLTADKPANIITHFSPALAPALFSQSLSDCGNFEALNNTEQNLYIRLTLFILCVSRSSNLPPDKIAKELFSKLKYSNNIRHFVNVCIENIDLSISNDKIFIRKCLNRMGVEEFNCLCKVKSAISGEYQLYEHIFDTVRQICSCNECFSLKALAVSGSDLISEFNLSGKEVGSALDMLLNAVMEEKCENDYNSIISYFTTKKGAV